MLGSIQLLLVKRQVDLLNHRLFGLSKHGELEPERLSWNHASSKITVKQQLL
jgi:hypothetical protein